MSTTQNGLLMAVKADNRKGAQLLGERWPRFVQALQNVLQQDSGNPPEFHDGLLLFHFREPEAACRSWSRGLGGLKKKVDWQAMLGPVPLRLVMDLAGEPPSAPDPAEATAAAPAAATIAWQEIDWEQLTPEIPYLTAALRQYWEEADAHEQLGEHRLGEPENGLTPLLLAAAGHEKQAPLFPHRHLPRQGKLPPCFYCGMTNHAAAACPTKMLTMQSQGLPTVGYLPLATISELFQQAMTSQQELNGQLAAGISPAQLRKDDLLRVYVSYFDLNKVYQPRFLAAIALTAHSRWESLGRPEAISTDNSNFSQGLDGLRVGQYQRSDEQFVAESRRPKGKVLYATIGRALVALEQERLQDIGHYLESGLKMALTDKDRIYVNLLLARYYLLMDNAWKATQALDNIISFNRDCPEANYRQILLGIRYDRQHSLNRLRTLIGQEKTYFIHTLMEPELLPVADSVEDILRGQLQRQRQEAEESLAQARVTCQEMDQWLAPEDEELQTLRGDLEIIEQHEARQSYYDLLDVSEQSRQLLQSCHRLQEARIDALYKRLEQVARQLESFRRLWREYPYKSFFPNFQETLDKVEKTVGQISGSSLKNLTGARYRALIDSLGECDQGFTTMSEMTGKMVWVRTLLNAAQQFVRSLVMAEVVLISLLVLLVVGLVFFADLPVAAGLAEVIRESAVQRRLLLVVTLILAPAVALIHTLWRTTES
ncbi:MAG: hypothetical protein U5J62_01055 [Desulfurivibrio sp.]|nr:hypothetical protein [Desulfurivibrio sp.]